jgi:hypothetical protein
MRMRIRYWDLRLGVTKDLNLRLRLVIKKIKISIFAKFIEELDMKIMSKRRERSTTGKSK